MEATYDTILVGGTGFIGSWLAQALVQNGERVLSIARKPQSNQAGETYVIDIADQTRLIAEFPFSKTVFILIGQNHQNFQVERELDLLRGLIEVLNQRLPQQVVYLSSALVYGETISRASEEHPCQPVEAYSAFKRAAEELLQQELRPTINLGIVRLANVYGAPGNRGFIGRLMERTLASPLAPMELNGEGKQKRDYIFIDDVIQALLSLKHQLSSSDIINVATGESATLTQVVDTLVRVSGVSLGYTLNHKVLAEVQTSLIDPGHLQTAYGFATKYTLESGLRKAWERYQTAQATV